MSNSSSLNHVALVGASGNIGTHMLKAVLEHPSRPATVTVIVRESSTATFPSGVDVHKIDFASQQAITAALKGVEAIVITLSFHAGMEQQIAIIDAAADAGVKYVLPNEFGSDTAHPSVSEIPMNSQKYLARDAVAKRGMKWIALVANPWFEYGMAPGFFGVSLKDKTAKIWDDGNNKTRLTSMAGVGRAVAGILALPATSSSGPSLAKYSNKHVYVSDLWAGQNDILASAQRVTGTSSADWKVSYASLAEDLQKNKALSSQGDFMGIIGWLYALTFSTGNGAQYEGREISSEELGLKPVDLDTLMKGVEAVESSA